MLVNGGVLPKVLVAVNHATTTTPPVTSRKKGFHSPLLVPNVFGPRLEGPSVPVHLKMWTRGH
jgi:hypothetical protein